MADRKINEFPTLETLSDDDLLLIDSEEESYNTTVGTFKAAVAEVAQEAVTEAAAATEAAQAATQAAQGAVTAAETATEKADEAIETAEAAQTAAEAAQTAAGGAASSASAAQGAASAANASATQAATSAAAAQTAAQTANETANRALDTAESMSESLDDLEIDKDDLGLEQDEETGIVYPTYKGNRSVNGIPLAATGGGGGSSSAATLRVRNLLSGDTFTIPYNEGCTFAVQFSFSSVYTADNESTGAGTVTYYVDGVARFNETIEQGNISKDVGEYLTAGRRNTVRVVVRDQEGNTKSLVYYVTPSYNYITSSFPAISRQTGSFQIDYTPVGSGTKTIYFKIDGVVDNSLTKENVTSSNRQIYQTFAALEHGAHTIEIYMSTVLEGFAEPITSNVLTFDVLAIEAEGTDKVLCVKSGITSAQQYAVLSIPFMVYDPAGTTRAVSCYADGTLVTDLNVFNGVMEWQYTFLTPGAHTLVIEFGDQSETLNITVDEVSLVARAETEGLKFHFTAVNRNNSEPNPAQYSFTNEDGDTYGMTFNNMRFTNDGWTGRGLNIGVGSSVDVDYTPFARDVTGTVGKTIELAFKAKNVYNYGSNIISCFANAKGLQITANNGNMAINATDSIDVQFNDDTEVRLSFVISARNSANDGAQQLIYVYANGAIAGVLKYGTNDTFSQLDAAGIHIGSDYAGIELYSIRCYEVALTPYGVLDNFIVDSPDPATMLERDARNDIFDEVGEVDYDKLGPDTPYMIISCPELPQYKGDKKTGVSGRFVDKKNPEKSFTFAGAEFDVQGTSSAGYYVKNFKPKFKGGFTNNDGETSAKYALTEDDIPVNSFCLKADVASSEGVNNVVLMKLWEATTPYLTPPQQNDARVRQTVNSRPMVVFWENSVTGELHFQGKYNFNNDKGTHDTFGFVDNEEHTVQCWEFKDNGLALTEFRGTDFDSLDANGNPVWQTAFEARFPSDFEDTTRLKRVVGWVASTNTAAATGNALASAVPYEGVRYTNDTAEYRLAKFKAEFEDYFIKSNVLWYYCFTDLFLMVDSRAKNQFITTFDGTHWLFLPYDGDTALGIDNIGALKFGYWLEDTDTVGGNDVYNGQRSVLWNNVRTCFKDDIITLITQDIDLSKLTYANVAAAFNEHQSAWPEAIFCADTQVKYITPYLETSVADYLNMAQGSKRLQRDYWLYNRLAYWFSKYHVASDVSNYIMFRMSEPADASLAEMFDMNLHITPYKPTYLNVQYGGSASALDRTSLQTVKANANEQKTIQPTLDAGRDSTVYIFGAPAIKDIGDLSPMFPKIVNISNAVNLERLIIGSTAEGYVNESLTQLNIGNNRKLKIIDVRNCSNLAGAIGASACDNLEELYADGTKITSVSLPATGALKVLRLPATIESLMLKDQTSIETLNIAGYTNLTSLYVDNCPSIDMLAVLNSAPNLTNVYLANVDWTGANALPNTSLLNRLLALGGKDENGEANTEQSVLTGSVHVPSITSSEKAAFERAWKGLTITHDTLIPQYTVTFVDDEGNLLYTEYVNRGETITEPIAAGYISTPTKASTVEKVYTFDSWTGASFDAPVARDTEVTAVFTEATRQYTVTFKVEGSVVQTDTVNAHGSTAYAGDTPSKTDDDVGMVYYLFNGWDAATDDIVADTVVNAVFLSCSPPANIVDMDAFTAAAAEEGKVAFMYTNFNELYPEGKTGVDPRVSAYTFEEFYALQKSPIFKDYFRNSDQSLRYGDMIEIWLDDNATGKVTDNRITAWVNSFNHYERADGNGMAHVSWDLKYTLNASRQMNTSNTNVGGWYDPTNNRTAMRNWLANTMIKALPDMFQRILTRVDVVSSIGNGKSDSTDITTVQDYLYLLSSTDVFGNTTAPYKWETSENAEKGDGMTTFQMPLYAVTDNRKKKTANADGAWANWWLRSPVAGYSVTFVGVGTGGSSGNFHANTSYGVAFGFCIG